MFMAPARRRDPDLRDLKAENFADLLWSDHIIVGKHKCPRGIKGEKVGLFIYDVATHVQDITSRILRTPSPRSCTSSATMPGRGCTPTDNAGEIAVAAEKMRMVHATSTPHRQQSNGLCENSWTRSSSHSGSANWRTSIFFSQTLTARTTRTTTMTTTSRPPTPTHRRKTSLGNETDAESVLSMGSRSAMSEDYVVAQAVRGLLRRGRRGLSESCRAPPGHQASRPAHRPSAASP